MVAVRPAYTVNAVRDRDWWAITVDELPGVFSQARRLDQVERMAREAISLLLDVPPAGFDLSIRQRLAPQTEQVVLAAKEARAEAVAHQLVASARSRHAAHALADQGLPQRDIGRLLELSHQRVAQLLKSAPTRPRRRHPKSVARSAG
jgi:predicted RNase H-like HicB family nuclease